MFCNRYDVWLEVDPTSGAPHNVQTHILLQSHTSLSCHTIFKPINSSWHQNQAHKSKFIQAHTDIKRLLQILILPQVYHTLESTAYNIYHCRHSWQLQEHDPSICLDSNFHTIITHTHSSYQMYIVLTFDSLFIVQILSYVLTKFNTALGQ